MRSGLPVWDFHPRVGPARCRYSGQDPTSPAVARQSPSIKTSTAHAPRRHPARWSLSYIIPFGYGAPYPSASGTPTHPIWVLPSTHYPPFRFPPAPPPEVTLRPLPSPATGLPRLPVSPSLRAVPTTPADRNGCIRRLLPRFTRPSPNLRRVGVHIFTFEACSGFTRVRPARSLNRPRRPLSQGFGPAGYPTRPPVSYQIKPTTLWVDPSSTGVTRRRGARRYPGSSIAVLMASSNSAALEPSMRPPTWADNTPSCRSVVTSFAFVSQVPAGAVHTL